MGQGGKGCVYQTTDILHAITSENLFRDRTASLMGRDPLRPYKVPFPLAGRASIEEFVIGAFGASTRFSTHTN